MGGDSSKREEEEWNESYYLELMIVGKVERRLTSERARGGGGDSIDQ